MLQVVSLSGFDIIRDGGSHVAFFAGADPDVSYELVFQIDRDSCSNWDHLRFQQAILTTYTSNPYISPVTGISSPRTDKESKNISWEEACEILECLRPKLTQLESPDQLGNGSNQATRDSELFERMVNAAANHGQA